MRRKTKPTATEGSYDFVMDASVALAWYFHDENDSYAHAVSSSLLNATPVVPAIWHIEVANALVCGERRGRGSQAFTSQWTEFISALPITVDQETSLRSFGHILFLARAHALSAYDAAYLELAIRRGLPLATLDRSLQAAAKKVGVELYRP